MTARYTVPLAPHAAPTDTRTAGSPRKIPPQPSSRRSPSVRRPARQRRAPLRARLFRATTTPKDHRGSAGPRPVGRNQSRAGKEGGRRCEGGGVRRSGDGRGGSSCPVNAREYADEGDLVHHGPGRRLLLHGDEHPVRASYGTIASSQADFVARSLQVEVRQASGFLEITSTDFGHSTQSPNSLPVKTLYIGSSKSRRATRFPYGKTRSSETGTHSKLESTPSLLVGA